jgi:hypothetical protein
MLATLAGIADFAVVISYLSTATKWGQDKVDVLHQLFTTGAWLPPAVNSADEWLHADTSSTGAGPHVRPLPESPSSRRR